MRETESFEIFLQYLLDANRLAATGKMCRSPRWWAAAGRTSVRNRHCIIVPRRFRTSLKYSRTRRLSNNKYIVVASRHFYPPFPTAASRYTPPPPLLVPIPSDDVSSDVRSAKADRFYKTHSGFRQRIYDVSEKRPGGSKTIVEINIYTIVDFRSK